MTSWAKFKREHLFAPNGLSVFRGLLGLSLPFLIFHYDRRYHVAALILFVIGAWTDYFDGKIARTHKLESKFGRFIDPLTDKILMLLPLICFAKQDFYSIWWLVPILFREIIITFCRIGWMIEGQAIGAEKLGKWKLGMQVALVSMSFIYFLSIDYGVPHGVLSFINLLMQTLLLITIVLTLVSRVSYIRNNRKHFSQKSFQRYVSAVGVGLLPLAPGTWGTLMGLVIIYLTHWNFALYVCVFLLLIAVGYWTVSKLQLAEGEDPHYVVLDEVLGMMAVFLFGIPFNPWTALAGFMLFRFFDIVKPFPLRRLERLRGFTGILTDDLGAGIYTGGILLVFYGLTQAAQA